MHNLEILHYVQDDVPWELDDVPGSYRRRPERVFCAKDRPTYIVSSPTMVTWNEILKKVRILGTECQKNFLKLATAESCTGGLIAALFTEIAGSSLWFDRGFITYSNVAKQEMLHVPEALLEIYGAVSKETACAMVEGALAHSAADAVVAVTGVAGPDGGSAEKPVGLVHFAWAMRWKETEHAVKHFSGNRQEIRLQSCMFAIERMAAIITSKK